MARCRECNGEIRFDRLPNGKLRPVELDGSDHFDVCSTRQMEVILANGQKITDQNGTRYRWKMRTYWTHQVGKTITGEHFDPCPYECKVPPWEDCLDCPRNIPTAEQVSHLRDIMGGV